MILRGDPEIRGLYSEKIGPVHLQRLAAAYARQSTAQQVLDHREPTRLQYGLSGDSRAGDGLAERPGAADR